MNFIGKYILDDLSLCDEIIEFYAASNNKQIGSTSKGIDLKVKNSTDVCITWQNDEIARKYVNALDLPTKEYIKKYNFCDSYSAWSIIEPINIQHYKPNGGFYKWHTERSNSTYPVTSRHLAFMTYLNDVEDGGETEFYYQKLKVKPRKGLTLIWPADWTHTHRGIPSPTEEKYIITGWFNYNA
jgi:hypothetical protein